MTVCEPTIRLLALVADIGVDDFGSAARNSDRIAAVDVGDGGEIGAGDQNRHADQRQPGRVGDFAGNRTLLIVCGVAPHEQDYPVVRNPMGDVGSLEDGRDYRIDVAAGDVRRNALRYVDVVVVEEGVAALRFDAFQHLRQRRIVEVEPYFLRIILRGGLCGESCYCCN